METLVTILAVWAAISVACALVWMLTGFALREARRRWPSVAIDPKWRRQRPGRYRPRD